MAINKVEYGGRSLIDLTADSVTPETLLEGTTAHNKAGEQIVGTAKSGGGAGHFEKVEILQWTPASDTRYYTFQRIDVKYCIIADTNQQYRYSNAVQTLTITNAEFYAGYKPMVEFITDISGNLISSVNYKGKDMEYNQIRASANFLAGRTYDVILVY